MFAIEEIITDTAGQDARKLCAGLVNGAPLFEKEVREDLRTFVPSRSVNISREAKKNVTKEVREESSLRA
jgi:hypothetical protein